MGKSVSIVRANSLRTSVSCPSVAMSRAYREDPRGPEGRPLKGDTDTVSATEVFFAAWDASTWGRWTGVHGVPVWPPAVRSLPSATSPPDHPGHAPGGPDGWGIAKPGCRPTPERHW